MSVYLLDVNLLLALAWPTHIHHAAAHGWFAQDDGREWATCPLTQLAFVRLSMQPAVVKVPILFGDAMQALETSTSSAGHHFWPHDSGVAGIREEIRGRITGHKQLADAVLLDLAVREGGRLATFDRRITALLPAESALRDAVAVIPS